jgi:hypothetical protein
MCEQTLISTPSNSSQYYERREVEGESFLMLLAAESHSEVATRLDISAAPTTSLSRIGAHCCRPRCRRPQLKRRVAALGLDPRGNRPAGRALLLRADRDVSREREAEIRKDDFLTQTSHEIRTPLSKSQQGQILDQEPTRARDFDRNRLSGGAGGAVAVKTARTLRTPNSAKPTITPISPPPASAMRR